VKINKAGGQSESVGELCCQWTNFLPRLQPNPTGWWLAASAIRFRTSCAWMVNLRESFLFRSVLPSPCVAAPPDGRPVFMLLLDALLSRRWQNVETVSAKVRHSSLARITCVIKCKWSNKAKSVLNPFCSPCRGLYGISALNEKKI